MERFLSACLCVCASVCLCVANFPQMRYIWRYSNDNSASVDVEAEAEPGNEKYDIVLVCTECTVYPSGSVCMNTNLDHSTSSFLGMLGAGRYLMFVTLYYYS